MDLKRKTKMYKVAGQMKMFGIFQCPECGKEVEKRLQHGKIQKTCGCKKHGGYADNLYKVWSGIKRRCNNPNEDSYDRYGGRGIVVCDEWKNKYPPFKIWAEANGYRKGLQIDRINNDGNYEPDNCRFVTPLENARNKNRNVLSMQFARVIRRLHFENNMTFPYIGKLFDIDPSLVKQVVFNQIWKESYLLDNKYNHMTLNEYQDLTLEFLQPQCNNLEYLTLGLCGEAGEVAEKIKRLIRGDGKLDETLLLELGDVLFYLARIAGHINVSFEQVAQMNIDKLTQRLAKNTIKGKGDKR